MDLEQIDMLPQRNLVMVVDKVGLLTKEPPRLKAFLSWEDNLFVENGRLNACALAKTLPRPVPARLGYVSNAQARHTDRLYRCGERHERSLTYAGAWAIIAPPYPCVGADHGDSLVMAVIRSWRPSTTAESEDCFGR